MVIWQFALANHRRIRGIHTRNRVGEQFDEDDMFRMQATSEWIQSWAPSYEVLGVNQKAAVDMAVFERVQERFARVGVALAPAAEDNPLGLHCGCEMCALYVCFLSVNIAGTMFTPVHETEVDSDSTDLSVE